MPTHAANKSFYVKYVKHNDITTHDCCCLVNLTHLHIVKYILHTIVSIKPLTYGSNIHLVSR